MPPTDCNRAAEIPWEEYLGTPTARRFEAFREHYPTCRTCSAQVASWNRIESALRTVGDPADDVSQLLFRFAERPNELSEEERGRVERVLERAPGARDELDVLRDFDFGLAAEGESMAEPKRGKGRELLASLLRGPVLVPIAALAAVLLVVLSLRSLDPDPARDAVVTAQTQPSPPPGPEIGPETAPEIAPEIEVGSLPRQVDPTDVREPPMESPELAVAQTEPPPAAESERGPAPRAEAPPAPRAEAPPATLPEPAPQPTQIAMNLPSRSPVYAAPAGAPATRYGGLLRSQGTGNSIVALSPLHTGRTALASPAIYWYLAEPTERAVAISVVGDDGIRVLLEKVLPGPHRSGIHRLSLGDEGIALARGETLQWYVSLLAEAQPGPDDLVSGARILRTTGSGSGRGSTSARGAQAWDLAAQGLWYDAFDALGQAPPTARRRHRAALLDQADLPKIAEALRR